MTDEPRESSTHPCAATGCPRRVPHSILMCGPHWKMVPTAQQRALWAAYKRAPGGSGRAVLTQSYVDAMQACVTAVEQAEAIR